jgi:NADH dehydrogenase
MGVDVRLNSAVAEISDSAVILASGEQLATASPVWTAGVSGAPLATEPSLERVRGGRIPVRPTLQALEHDNIFVIGDIAYLEQDGVMLPGVAQVAMQQGLHVARNIAAMQRGLPLQPFRYRDKGAMATVGRNAAVAQIGGRLYTGFVAWSIWLAVHIFFLIGFRNRLGVLLNWAWNYLFYERAVRLILPNATRL